MRAFHLRLRAFRGGVIALLSFLAAYCSAVEVDRFDRADSNYHGDNWETLLPGFWKIEDHALRRDLRNIPDGPYGMIWNREWKLTGNFSVTVHFEVVGGSSTAEDLLGICFGGASLYECWRGGGEKGDASYYAAWRGNGGFGIYDHSSDHVAAVGRESSTRVPKAGDRVQLRLVVSDGSASDLANVQAELSGAVEARSELRDLKRVAFTEGFFGVVCRGALDFKATRVTLDAPVRQPRVEKISNLHVAIPYGMALQQRGGHWFARILCAFRDEGRKAQIRISREAEPTGGWEQVDVAGEAPIVTNAFREHTAVVEVRLPDSPASCDLFYTVWKDGTDVTADPRTQRYVGKLPRLAAPYKLAGFGGHSISAKEFTETNKTFPWNIEPSIWRNRNSANRIGPDRELFQSDWIFEQYDEKSFQHFSDYGTQILIWEDDIWYLEIPVSPPSTRDAYKRVMLTIAGRVQRRMMMQNWNVLSPGDHDFGMDDFRGTEQWAVRNLDKLPQDGEYLRRNFGAIWHLCTGDERHYTVENPVRYGRWRMPAGDFSIVLTDSRLWRTTTYADIWETAVYMRGKSEDLEYAWRNAQGWDRRDPTRSIVGEAQFSWLEQVIRTDPSPAILVVGINGLHSFTHLEEEVHGRYGKSFQDFAAFNKASADRLIHLLSSRSGVVSIYGDVHFSAALFNPKARLMEGIIGSVCRTGSRTLKPDWGPVMTDWDGRELEVRAIFHKDYASPRKEPIDQYVHFGFVGFEFDVRDGAGSAEVRIRHIHDAPNDPVRGGGAVSVPLRDMGRPPLSYLPPLETFPHADVRLARVDGMPIRALRADAAGGVESSGLADIPEGTPIVITSTRGTNAASRITHTSAAPGSPVETIGDRSQ